MDLTNLSSGLLGSTIAAVTTFIAAAFTLWRSRVGDRQREAVRIAEREQERREALAGQLVSSLKVLESEARWAPLLRGRTLRHFLKSTMTFYASQHKTHPEVADWLMAQCDPYQDALRRWHRVCLVPIINSRRLAAVGTLTGELDAAIIGWATGQIPDTAFADPDRSPREVARVAAALNVP